MHVQRKEHENRHGVAILTLQIITTIASVARALHAWIR